MLNILSGFIPTRERIITIEDSAELQLQQEHVARLETRPPNVEGKGEITQRDLVRNSLRMRPDRIVVGEVRGAEVIDMFQAMNTGHEGSMTTVHANTARDALLRLETMMQLSGFKITEKAMRQMISSSLDVIIQLARHSDGVRRMISLSEITGMESGVISMQDIFVFERHALDEQERVVGRFISTGVRPHFADRCKIFGIPINDKVFSPSPPGMHLIYATWAVRWKADKAFGWTYGYLEPQGWSRLHIWFGGGFSGSFSPGYGDLPARRQAHHPPPAD